MPVSEEKNSTSTTSGLAHHANPRLVYALHTSGDLILSLCLSPSLSPSLNFGVLMHPTGPQPPKVYRRVVQKSGRRASQCGQEVVVTAVFKERPSDAANRADIRRQSHRQGKPKNVVNLTDRICSAGGKKRNQTRFPTKAKSNGGAGDEAGVRALIDRRGIIIDGDAERTAASSSESRRGCSAKSSSSVEVNVPRLKATRKPTPTCDGDGDGHHNDTTSRVELHARQGVAPPRTMAGDSDAISELSSESFTPSSVDDEENGCKCLHKHSNEPPCALLMAPPIVEDNDAVNISQGGAHRSEIERASPRWKQHAESGTQAAGAARIPASTATGIGQPHGRPNPKHSAPRRASFGKSSVPSSTAAPGFEYDGRSKSRCAAPSTWSTRRNQISVLGTLDAVNANEDISEVGSPERSPLGRNNVFDEDGRERSYRQLEEEIVSLKRNLRRAEIRQAAAEATASSVLQRAQAAELSREVKEIQARRWMHQIENTLAGLF